MFNKIRRNFKYIRDQNKEHKFSPSENKNSTVSHAGTLHNSMESNLLYFKNALKPSPDVIFREFVIADKNHTKAFICWIDGLTDKNIVEGKILQPLMNMDTFSHESSSESYEDLLAFLDRRVLPVSELNRYSENQEVIENILDGKTVLFIDGYNIAFTFGSQGWEARPVSEPDTEMVVRGPREGFVESLYVNFSLIRRKIKNSNLVFKKIKLGSNTNTSVCICYLNGVASEDIVTEVTKRLQKIKTPSILESGYIEQFIEDHPFSLFSTIGNSERVDTVSAKILGGKVAILCDGTPFVLTLPHLFIENFQISEDYYSRPFASSIIRLIRLLSFFITLLAPALYIAVETFHQEMIPTILLVTMAASHEGIPFPAFVETFLMGITFEILRESGIRLPRAVGQAVSIVGALVVGEAAVNAGIVSAPMVIVMALTGITSFIVSPIYDFIVVMRFILVILSGAFGLFGIVAGLIIMLAHMCSLRTCGIPFLAPLSPVIWKDLKDTFIRAPLWLMNSVPKSNQYPIFKNKPTKTKKEE